MNNEEKSNSKKVVGIVLAAGFGKRMRCTKQLLYCLGQTLLERVVSIAEASSLNKVIVVLGYDAEKILRETNFTRATTLINHSFIKGQSTSLATGIFAIYDNYDAAMFILGDQPLITTNIINKLIYEYRTNSGEKIIIPTYKGKRGNPVIFNRYFFSKLLLLVGDVGGRNLIKKYKNNVIEVSCNSDSILFDLDTPEDYKIFNSKVNNNANIL